MEKHLAQAAAPHLETLLQPHRLLLLQLSTQASADTELIQLVNQSMRPVLEHARHQSREKLVALQERRAVVLEEKLRLVKEAKARIEAERPKPEPEGGCCGVFVPSQSG